MTFIRTFQFTLWKVTTLHQDMVISDFYAKIDFHTYFAIWTLKSFGFAPKFYTKVDIHPYFALLTLRSDEIAPNHGYSWFVCKSWLSFLLGSLDFKKWRTCTKTWLFFISTQQLTFIHTLRFKLEKVTSLHQNMVIPGFYANVDINP